MTRIWRDSLVIPAYISIASAAILILHVILISKTFKRLYARLLPKSMHPGSDPSAQEHLQGVHPASFIDQMREHIALHGGSAIFAHKVARFVGCAVLLGVSIATLILETGQVRVEDVLSGKYWGNKYDHRRQGDEVFTEAGWLQVALCITTVRVSMNR